MRGKRLDRSRNEKWGGGGRGGCRLEKEGGSIKRDDNERKRNEKKEQMRGRRLHGEEVE